MSKDAIVVDPTLWTGIGRPEWPRPADYPFPAPLIARESQRKMLLGALVFLSLGGGVLSLVNAMSFEHLARLVIGCLLILLGAASLWRSFRPRVMVSMDARGLAMPFWFEKAVPWSEVEDVAYQGPWALRRRLHYPLRIAIREPLRFGPTPYARRAAAVSIPVFLGNSYDVSAKALFDTMQAYRAHFGGGGKAT